MATAIYPPPPPPLKSRNTTSGCTPLNAPVSLRVIVGFFFFLFCFVVGFFLGGGLIWVFCKALYYAFILFALCRLLERLVLPSIPTDLLVFYFVLFWGF